MQLHPALIPAHVLMNLFATRLHSGFIYYVEITSCPYRIKLMIVLPPSLDGDHVCQPKQTFTFNTRAISPFQQETTNRNILQDLARGKQRRACDLSISTHRSIGSTHASLSATPDGESAINNLPSRHFPFLPRLEPLTNDPAA